MKKIINLLLVLLLSGSLNAGKYGVGSTKQARQVDSQARRVDIQAKQKRVRQEEARLAELAQAEVERARQAEQTRAKLAEETRLADIARQLELAELEKQAILLEELVPPVLLEEQEEEQKTEVTEPGFLRKVWNKITNEPIAIGGIATGTLMALKIMNMGKEENTGTEKPELIKINTGTEDPELIEEPELIKEHFEKEEIAKELEVTKPGLFSKISKKIGCGAFFVTTLPAKILIEAGKGAWYDLQLLGKATRWTLRKVANNKGKTILILATVTAAIQAGYIFKEDLPKNIQNIMNSEYMSWLNWSEGFLNLVENIKSIFTRSAETATQTVTDSGFSALNRTNVDSLEELYPTETITAGSLETITEGLIGPKPYSVLRQIFAKVGIDL